MKIFVTGANGFVGRHLVSHLLSCGHEVTSVVRRRDTANSATKERVTEDIGPETAWSGVLLGHDAVIHLAARVHVMNETATDPLEEFRRVNSLGTKALAKAAAAQGVRRFVLLSSIKVNGESTSGIPYTVSDIPSPRDPYGISKLEAEQALRDIEATTSFNAVVVRSPLVYGPGVGGNFIRLLDLVRSGMPIPFGAVNNRRTMLAVWNLVDLLEKCVTRPDIGGMLVLAGDKESISTPELMRKMAVAMKVPSRVFWFPVPLLYLGGRIVRKSALVQRLAGSLEIAAGANTVEWLWQPPISLDEGIRRTVEWYKASDGGGLK